MAAPVDAGPNPALINRPRASEVMRRAGLDAIVVTAPMNVYYATRGIPLLSRFTQIHMTAALIPADPARTIAYVGSGFEYYLSIAVSGLAENVDPYLVAGTYGPSDDPRQKPGFARALLHAQSDAEDIARLEKPPQFYPGMAKALAKAIADRGLLGGKFGVDCSDARALLQEADPAATLRPADDLMLHIRVIKTPAEMALMRKASEINVEASLVAARATREEGSIAGVRQRFFAEASRRGNVPVYAGVDLVVGELTDGEFREGQAIMVDFVSHYGFYQGDYGRTVFYGEPAKATRKAVEVGVTAWDEIREHLKPGLKFSEISQIGHNTVKRLEKTLDFAFAPHLVGLQHRDHPVMSIEGKFQDIVLEEGMVLSVDCPCLNANIDGTIHNEDLMLITTNGSEPLNELGNYVIVV